MPTNIEEYWVMHRPRHPIWGSIMFASIGASATGNPPGTAGISTQLYTGDEKDYLFYKYSPTSGNPYTYAVTEKPWLQHTICYSMQDAVVAAKRLISFVGQDNVRICKIINGKQSISF